MILPDLVIANDLETPVLRYVPTKSIAWKFSVLENPEYLKIRH